MLPHLLLLVIASRAPQYPSLAHARFPRTASARRGGGRGSGGGGGDAAGEGAAGGAAVESAVEEARGVELLFGESEVLGESEGGGDRGGRVCRHGIPPPPPAEAPPPTPPAPARCTISRDVAYRDHRGLLQGTSIMIHRPYRTNSGEVHNFNTLTHLPSILFGRD